MMWLFFSCSPPEISVYGQMHTEDSVQIDWNELLYRPERVNWYDSWTVITPVATSHLLGTEPELLAVSSLAQEPHVHFFTDAQSIIYEEAELDDIIEPIACPTPSFGKHDIFITYIVIDKEIFAMDCVVE